MGNTLKTLLYTKKGKILAGFASAIILISILFVILGMSPTKTTVKSCVVQFDTQGGTNIKPYTVKCGNLINKPKDTKKGGFTFTGWHLDGKAFNFKKTVINKDTILTAHWILNENTEVINITFDSDGGSLVAPIQIGKGYPMGEPIAPIKEGYTFEGWYLDGKKYNFADNVEQALVLKAKWKKASEGSKGKEADTNTSTKKQSDTTKKDKDSSKLKWEDIAGTWYLEGSDDIYISIYKEVLIDNKTWMSIMGQHVNVDRGSLYAGYDSGGTGGSITRDVGVFIDYYGISISKDSLKLTSNGTTLVFYKQKNYPTHKVIEEEHFINALDGYYWYLDGSQYAYLHPNVIPWYDHEILQWKSANIDLSNNKFITTETTGIEYPTSANIQNTLLLNPLSIPQIRIMMKEFNMSITNNKLYISIGDNRYSFTRYSNKKDTQTTITLNKTNISTKEYGSYEIVASITPAFAPINLTATTSDINVTSCRIGDKTADGKVSIHCITQTPGYATVTIQDMIGGSSTSFSVQVNDVIVNVSGITLTKKNLELMRGSSEQLNAIITPEDADNKSFYWSSSDERVVTARDGMITAWGNGTATVTVQSADGNYRDYCIVHVVNPPLQASVSIGPTFMNGVSGVSAVVTPSGGSGIYTSTFIKLFKDGQLIGEQNNPSGNMLFIKGIQNGSFYVEYTLQDSEGNFLHEISQTVVLSN